MRESLVHHKRRAGARRFLASRRAAAASEFALVLPIFMLCVFGITAFASTLFIENNMVNAARESVRQIAVLDVPFAGADVQCDSTQAQTVGTAENVACTYLAFWGTDFTVNASGEACPGINGDAQSPVAITLDAQQAAIMDVFGFFNGKTLTADVSMRRETC